MVCRMMCQIGGPIGPFFDEVQQRQVPVTVTGTCDYSSAQPNDPHVQAQILKAIHDVVGYKLHHRELTFAQLNNNSVAQLIPQIIRASGLDQSGIRVGELTMAFGLDGNAPQQPAIGRPPANPSTGSAIMGSLKERAKDRMKTEVIWWAGGCLVMIIVLIGLAGLALYIWHSVASDSATAPAATWDGKTPFTCGANDVVTFKNIKANVTGTAITALGNCSVTLVDVDITADTGIEAGGNGSVVMQKGSLNGSTLAVHATAASKVTFTGTKVTGKTEALNGAKITGP